MMNVMADCADVRPDNLAAVEAWIPAAQALTDAIRDLAAVDRLAVASGLPKWCVPAMKRCRRVNRQRVQRAASAARRLRLIAFGEVSGA